MKTLKNYVLTIAALFVISSVSYGQIVLASSKKRVKNESATTPQSTTLEAKADSVPAATFTLSGSIDTYFHSSFGTTNTVDGFQPNAPTTSFANLKGFGLGMANVIFAYQGEKTGFVADLVFGPRGSDAVFNSGGYSNLTGSGSGHIVNQLYGYYKLSDAVTFNLGQFNTFVGFEVISPAINVNYSTSYLFSNGPFSHTGLRADFTLGGGIVAKLAVMNPTDFLEFNPVDTYTLGGQIGYAGDAGSVYLSVLAGDQDGTLEKFDNDSDSTSAGGLFQIDVTTGWNLGEKFYLGFNASYQSVGAGEFISKVPAEGIKDATGDATSFVGFAIYPKVTISDNFALALRAEYFSVKKNHTLASPISVDPVSGDGNVIAATLSGNIKVSALTLIPEIRVDKMSENFFLNKDGEMTDLMPTFTFAAVYKF